LSEKIYRDPVHNIIRIDTDAGEGRLLARLIDTREFQRLRRVRQLGFSYFAYQGAEHSRFSHSLGALHLATRILFKLEKTYPISSEARTAIRCAALLHDVGHGAFSHAIESVFNFKHEDFTVEAILSPETEVNQALTEFSAELPEKVAGVIKGEHLPKALSRLVSSQLDVDRMDYLLRDSLMTGAKYGVYDLEWVIKALEIDAESDRLYVAAKGIYAVEDYLQARYYMFRQVYFHRTLRGSEMMFRLLLKRSLELAGKALWSAPDTAFHRMLQGTRFTLADHLETDDSDVMFHIKQWQKSEDGVLSDLSQRFINRRLFKAIDLDMPEDERSDFVSSAREKVAAAGFDPDYYFVEDKAADVAHYYYAKDGKNTDDLIYVEDGFSRPQIREISEISAAVRGLQKGFAIHRVCFPQETFAEISKLYYQ
jgi:hypothetical protein